MKKILSLILVLVLVVGMIPDIIPNVSAASGSVTYTFTYTARSDAGRSTTLEAADGTWSSVYKQFPVNPANPGENWAYLGSGVGRAVKPGTAYVQIARYVGTNRWYADEWTAFKIKVPETGKYILSKATGFAYSNGSQDLGIYLVPLDETYSNLFQEGNISTYGTISDGEYRKGHKTFTQLGIPENTKIGFTTDLRASSSTYDCELGLTDTTVRELESGVEYALVLRTTTAGAQTITSLTFDYEKEETKLTDIEVSFGDEVIVGTKLEPEIIWKSGENVIENASGEVSLEIIENESDALIDAGSGSIYARGEGSAIVQVTGTLNGVSVSVNAEVTVTKGIAYSGVDQQYLFYLNAYPGLSAVGFKASEINEETFTSGCACLEYNDSRPWAFVAAKASRPDNSGVYFKLYAKYLDLSARIGEWAAFKVKVPAPGKYMVDVGGYTYASGGKANIYMLPYEESMSFSEISANIDSYISEDNYIASADFNGTVTDSVVQKAVGSFVAADNLDYSKGYADYLMVVTTNRSDIKSSAYAVLLHSVSLIGSGGIDELDITMSDTEIGIGESTVVENVSAFYPGGGKMNLEDAFIRHSISNGASDILEISEDGKTFTAIGEGTAEIETLVIAEGSVASEKTTITVDDSQGVMNAFLYGEDEVYVGEELALATGIELNNRKLVDIGEVVRYDVVSQSEEGVLILSEDEKKVVAEKSGTAQLRAEISVRGKLIYTDTITVNVVESKLAYSSYPTDFSIDLRQGTYSGDAFSTLPEITEYSEHRNWIYHDFTNPNPQYKVIELPAKTAKYSYILWSSATAILRPSFGHFTPLIEKGDLLLVTQNNMLSGLMNGDLVTVNEVVIKERRAGLTFLKVSVKELFTGKDYSQLMIADILYGTQTNLTQSQQKELFIDFYYRMKEKSIKQGSKLFQEMMMMDPYLNALRAVFGYALTCHKAQGGEWDYVYLDIPKSVPGMQKPYVYQWIYTAMTRARKELYIVDGFWLM